jgi:hypothetical protein
MVNSNRFPLQNAIKKILDNPTTRPALPVLKDDSSIEDGSSVGDENFSKATRYDQGRSPDIALNNKNVVVEVHESESQNTLWYRIGQVEGKAITWRNDGKSTKYDNGVEPSVAITDNGLVVEAHKSQSHDTLWYRIGQVEGNTITWRNDGKGIQYDNGEDPSVSITNDGLVVEVHKSGGHSTLWYRIGQVEGNTITWRNNAKSVKYDDGVHPSVAITDGGQVVEVHRSEGHDTLWYRLGQVEGNIITWRNDGKSIKYDKGVQPSVAITDDGVVVEAHRSEGLNDTLWYRRGQTKGDTITWSNDDKSASFSAGDMVNVACNTELAVAVHYRLGDLDDSPSDKNTLSYSVLTIPSFRPNWIELRGENSYCYCACNSATNNKQRHASNHTMKIEAGAPYFYAVLTKDDDSIDFPTGAILTIQGPDGTKYDRNIQEENQLVIMSGSSVRCLIVKDPKPGDWKMTMTAPERVGFHCECNTVPSKDPYKTITTALSKTNQLNKRSLDDVTIAGWLGAAATGATIGATAGNATAGPLGALVGAVVGGTVGNVTYLTQTLFFSSPTPTLQTAATTLGQAAQAYAAPPGEIRIATWNVFHGDLQNGNDRLYNQPRIPLLQDRVNELVNFGVQNNIGLIAFQEMPQSILNNPNHPILTNIPNNYRYVIVNSEYPNAPAPASATTDGYLILYNPTVFTLQNIAPGIQWQYFQPQLFRQGLAQARPPVQLQFQIIATGTVFDFLTWHTEPQPAFARTYVEDAYNRLTQQQGNWIIAGDLNINDNNLPGGVVDPHHLTHDDRTLDHIIAGGTVIDPEANPRQPGRFTVSQRQWGRFWSDAHYVLFGIVRFP